MKAWGEFGQLHEILTVGAYINAIRIDSALASSNRPLQVAGGSGSGDSKAITDPRLDLGAFFVVVPGYKFEIG